MATIAVLPVKRFDRAKQRLGGDLDAHARETLAEAMVRDVLAALVKVPSLSGVVVVTGEPRAQALARKRSAAVVEEAVEQGQSAAARAGVARAIELGGERVLLVPGDCPAMDAHEVDGLLGDEDDDRPAVTVVPDRHGTGTNALVLSPPEVIEPAFGPQSFERHVSAAHAAGARLVVAHVPSLALDVDMPEDLAALGAAAVGGATAAALAGLRTATQASPAAS